MPSVDVPVHLDGTSATVVVDVVVAGAALVGGPLVVASSIRPREGRPLHLALTTDRARGRSEDVAFSAHVAGADVPGLAEDPLSSVPALGGVASSVTIAPDAPLQVRTVVNRYLRLELLRDLAADGSTIQLHLDCRRRLSLGLDATTAVSAAAGPALADVTLVVPLRRNDEELQQRLRADADALLARPFRQVPDDLLLLEGLVSLRHQLAAEALQLLSAHSDPWVRSQAVAALGDLPAA